MLIYTRFPGIRDVLQDNLSGASTPRGSAILGDLVTEGRCRRIIEDEVSKGCTPDNYFATLKRYDEIRKITLGKVHEVVLRIFGKTGPRR